MESSVWSGQGLSQNDFMKKDECITVDDNDKIIGHGSKLSCHQFLQSQPRGILHRAFSVFLFNSEGKLLLQQRALSKITFPGVWTNTCCSHPLMQLKVKNNDGKEEVEIDQTASEIDDDEAIASGTVMGAKRAAVRKLLHELGIEAKQVPIEKFKFLTRLHYWAGDWGTYGAQSEWGEHEIDYILFIQTDVDVSPNPDEVADTCYVTFEELKQMMEPNSGLKWSPWFRIIVERFLSVWWKDLQLTLTSDSFVDTKNIHRFDPPHIPKGVETTTKSKGDTSKKQGAYGKILTHKESKFVQLLHAYEIVPMLYLKIRGFGRPLKDGSENELFCDQIMSSVSRSFAAVTQQLPQQLRMPVTIFYLILRGLDTIEDDMEAFSDPAIKIDLLTKFHSLALSNKDFSMTGIGKGDEEKLLNEFHRVISVFQSLQPQVQGVIAEITRRMGEGMSFYVKKDLGQGTVTIAEYNKYCYYVAGIIGDGLSQLFSVTGLESPIVMEKEHSWYSMGLLLQKTNIIRDYLEDYIEGRTFWPQEIWKQYSTTGELGEFAKNNDKTTALHCLNHMITDALEYVPECFTYLARLHHPEVFVFCAIPQIMAIATLAQCYNNPKVFSGVVKIRKGMTCHIISTSSDLQQVKQWFHYFACNIVSKIPRNDPNNARTLTACKTITNLCSSQIGFWSGIGRFCKPGFGLFINLVLIMFFAILSCVIPNKTLNANETKNLMNIFDFEVAIALLLVASTFSVLHRISTSQSSFQ